jgi:hypothetical protein
LAPFVVAIYFANNFISSWSSSTVTGGFSVLVGVFLSFSKQKLASHKKKNEMLKDEKKMQIHNQAQPHQNPT